MSEDKIEFKEPSFICEKHGEMGTAFEISFINIEKAFRYKGCQLCLGEALGPFMASIGFKREEGIPHKLGFSWPEQD